MERTITGSFATRREAELAVEHLVQEHGLQRADIFIQPAGAANSAGRKAAGADVQSGHPGLVKHGAPELAGAIEVSVDCHDNVDVVEAALRDAGARQLERQ